jgi:hypothetical protein
VVVNGRDPDRFEAALADRMAGILVDRVGDPLDLGNVVCLPMLPGIAVPERGGHPGRRRRTPLDAVIIPSQNNSKFIKLYILFTTRGPWRTKNE